MTMPRTAAGFTLIELVAVIATLGILMAVAAPRFFSANTYAARAFKDDAAAFLRYAQKRAIAKRGTVAVVVESSGLTLCTVAGATCDPGNALAGPSGDSPFRSLTPNGVTLAASRSNLSFDAQGRPDAALTLTITGDLAHTVTVEAETGHVH
jgi:MSHA pilin protein MshC